MRFAVLLPALPLLALLGLTPALVALPTGASAGGRTERSDTVPVSALKKGMKGYGLTVFEGTKPERFDVEVIDVLRDFRPRQELLLVKTSHPRLEVAKIVAGMSGSPIYFNGKMAGAYSYGWSFGTEPVAGVTPISNMLEDLERPLPPTLRGTPLSVLPGRSRTADAASARSRVDGAEARDYDLSEHARRIGGGLGAPERPGLVPVATPLMLGGVGARTAAAARELLEPLGMMPLEGGAGSAPGSKSAGKGASSGYVDGGAIGVSLVRGDMSAMGLGTVTRVEGERLVAFGHPMMQVGVTALPTTEARVLWFMASVNRSFKVGEALSPLGTLVNDRQASIVVRTDIEPRTVPVKLTVRGEPGNPYRDWNFEVAHDAFLTPTFVALAIGSALESAAAERRDVTYVMRTKVRFAGLPELVLEDYGSSPTGTPGADAIARSDVVVAIGALFNNPWSFVQLESVEADIELTFARDVYTLRGVDLLTPEVEPGGEARLRVVLEPFSGPRQTRVIAVRIPEHLAGETVRLDIAPGYDVRRVRPAPESVAELASQFVSPTELPRSLVVSLETGHGDVAARGTLAKGLPPGALDVLTVGSSSTTPQQFRSLSHHVTPLPAYVVGRDYVSVKVKEQPGSAD